MKMNKTERIKQKLEDKLESLLLVRETTIDEDMIREISHQYNDTNLVYAKITGVEYNPK